MRGGGRRNPGRWRLFDGIIVEIGCWKSSKNNGLLRRGIYIFFCCGPAMKFDAANPNRLVWVQETIRLVPVIRLSWLLISALDHRVLG